MILFNFLRYLYIQYAVRQVRVDLFESKRSKEEIFEDFVSLLHCFSMKMYSRSKQNRIKKLSEEKDSVGQSGETHDKKE